MNDEQTPDGPAEDPDAEQPAEQPAEEPTAERPTEEAPASDRRPARRLLRSRDDRMIAGVAGGLGEYFAIDPTIVRIGFVISVFFGGLGALAYAALALFVPSAATEGEVEAAPVERSRGLAIVAGIAVLFIILSWGVFDRGAWFFDDGPWFFGPPVIILALGAGLYFLLRNTGNTSLATVVGKVVLALALLSLAFVAAAFSAWAGATGHGVAVAGVVVAIGVLLILSAFRGGARWLVAPAAVLAIPLGLVAAADVSFGDGVGNREYQPSSISALPDDGYELGVGRLEIDLREIAWEPDTVVDMSVDVGIGEAVVAVPESVCVASDVSARVGELDVAGSESDGIDPEIERQPPADALPRLNLSGEVDLGALRVINDDDLDLDRHYRDWHDWRDRSDSEREATMDAACAVSEPDEERTAPGTQPDDTREADQGGAPGDSNGKGTRNR